MLQAAVLADIFLINTYISWEPRDELGSLHQPGWCLMQPLDHQIKGSSRTEKTKRKMIQAVLVKLIFKGRKPERTGSWCKSWAQVTGAIKSFIMMQGPCQLADDPEGPFCYSGPSLHEVRDKWLSSILEIHRAHYRGTHRILNVSAPIQNLIYPAVLLLSHKGRG